MNLTAAVLWRLDEHHVPMHRALIAVASRLVRLTGREVEAACDFLVEENIQHRARDIRVEANGELTNEPRASVAVQNLVEALIIRAARRVHNLTVFELEADAFKTHALVERRRVVLDHTVDTVNHGAGVNLAVWDVAVTTARHRADAFNGKRQVCTATRQTHAVCLAHALCERLFRLEHLGVIQCADVEVKILERLGTHARRLRKGRRRVAQHDPARVIDAVIVDAAPQVLLVQLHAVGGDIGQLEGIQRAAHANVRIHLLHAA